MKYVSTSVLALSLIACLFVTGCESDQAEQPEPQGVTAEAVDEQPEEQPDDEQVVAADDELVELAGELGSQIETFRENPAELDAWLEQQEMTEEEFEQLLFDISQDATASRVYSQGQ